MLHGADYNPEQWLKYPEVLREDIRLMKLAGCNVMSVGIFRGYLLNLKRVCSLSNGWMVYLILLQRMGFTLSWQRQVVPAQHGCRKNIQKS